MSKKERIKKKHKKIMHRKARKIVRMFRNLIKFKSYYFGYRYKERPISIKYNNCSSNIIKRLPDDREIIAYRQRALEYMYFCGHEMKRSAYYTLKGMNRRNNNEENVMNFIRKRNLELADRIELYKQTEQQIYEWTIPISTVCNNETAKMGIIKEGDTDEESD